MLDIRNITFAISSLRQDGMELFLKSHATLIGSEVDGIYHYTSLLPAFDKIIVFDSGKSKETSLVLSDKNIKLSDFSKHLSINNSHYDFREDISKIKIGDQVYLMINGNVDTTKLPLRSVDARGNIRNADEIEVGAIIFESE
jgi:hypothetical protein